MFIIIYNEREHNYIVISNSLLAPNYLLCKVFQFCLMKSQIIALPYTEAIASLIPIIPSAFLTLVSFNWSFKKRTNNHGSLVHDKASCKAV